MYKNIGKLYKKIIYYIESEQIYCALDKLLFNYN